MTPKKVCLFALALSLVIASCSKKSDSPAPSSTTTTTTTTSSYPYYFIFTLDGVTDTIVNSSGMKTYSSSTNFVQSGVSTNIYTLLPSMDLSFKLPEWWDTVKESDVMGLAGRTVYFTDTVMQPELSYQPNDTTEWDSYGVNDSSYVKVDSVTFNGTDNYEGHAVRTYVIVGSCQAQMEKTFGYNRYLTGNFRMLLVRVTSW